MSAGHSASSSDDAKILVQFKHTGDAPMLKQSKFKVPESAKVSVVLTILRTQLQLEPDQSLFLYCNCAFAPPPDELIGDLAACFMVGNTLTLNYSLQHAWG